MTKATTNVARVAAAVAGLGLVAMSFAPLAGAQTSTTTTTSTTTSTTSMPTFTRDLTIGSTGADVMALQTWLISKGYSIPAGATGYFGTQTQAAVAAFQAANAITPAVGYFGPITRAKVASMGGSTTTTGGGTTTTGGSTSTTLSGGEADLRNFDLLAEDGEGSEGESQVQAATAEFDVDGGDVNVQRAELTLHAASSTLGARPWDYIDNVSVWANGKKLADMDADSRDDWDEEDADDFSGGDDNQYTITLDDLNYVVRDGDTADLTFAFDINDNIDDDDLAQQFDVAVLDDGIRAVDAAGIQQYTGDDHDQTDFNFGEEDNGDLSLRENSDNPDDGILLVDDNDTSDEMDVLVGDIRNKGDSDSLITDMTFTVATTGVTADLSDVVRRATLDFGGDTYRGDVNDDGTIDFDDVDTTVDSDDTETFTLSVELAPTSVSGFDEGDTLRFDLDGDNIDAEGDESGDDTDVDGSITGSTFTISETGVDVDSTSASSDTNDDQNIASFTIKFDVTAGDDDIYIPIDAAEDSMSASTTAGAVYQLLFNGSATSSNTGVTDVLSSSADKNTSNSAFIVRAGDTETFTLSVSVGTAAAPGFYEVDLEAVKFDDENRSTYTAPELTTFHVDDSNSDFQAGPENKSA